MKAKAIVKITVCIVMTVMLLALTACVNQQNNENDPGQSLIDPTDKKDDTIELFAMDTYMTIKAFGNHAQPALQEAATRIHELELLWSVTNPDSEIYALNHGDGSTIEVNPATAEALSFASIMADRTDGAFDFTVYPVLAAWGFTTGSYQIPAQAELDILLERVGHEKVLIEGERVTLPKDTQIDLGAVAKGYTADIVTAILKKDGITSALIDLGGNIQVIGFKPDGSKWRVGIKDVYGEGNVGVLEAADCAVVSSGGYERYFVGADGKTYWHIIDPSTGAPADSGLVSVTVIGKDGRFCDALSTALFVMGLQKAEKHWRSYGDFGMILMTRDNELYITEGLEEDFTLDKSRADMAVHILRKSD